MKPVRIVLFISGNSVIDDLSFFILGTAGAGSLILEFGVLSRLTGDERFEKAAYKAFFAIWNRRSDIGLVGNTINIYTGVRTPISSPFLVTNLPTGLDFSRNYGYWSRG